jgi:hypothetical protein
MTGRFTSSRAKQVRLIARIWLAILTVLGASLSATAAEHAASSNPSSPDGNDPFAVYEANLSDAASGALHRVAQPQAGTVTTPSHQKLVSGEMLSALPAHDMLGKWQRVEELRPILDPILSQVGIPVELTAVVVVESGGNPAALSPKGARGLWQLMPDTARRYGLTVNADTDERLDVLKSTRAAAEYLRDLYSEFHDWQLALAAYNAGALSVQQALVRTGGTGFSVAAPALPAETQGYVPAVLAVLAQSEGRKQEHVVGNARLLPAVYATMVW